MGAPKWPPNPQRSEAPRPRRGAPRAPASGPAAVVLEAGGVVTLADGAPVFPALPASLAGAAIAVLAGNRTSHHQALVRFLDGGPEMAPNPPAFGSAPATPWRSSGLLDGRG